LRRENKAHLRFWRDEFFLWNGRHYEVMPRVQLQAELARFMNRATTVNEKGQRKQFVTTTKIVDEVLHQIMWDRKILISPTRDDRTGPDGAPAHHLIVCRNGMLDIDAEELRPHSPDYLFLNSLPIDYDPTAAEPIEWMKFLGSLWPDDDGSEGGSISCLQEVFGYILAGDADLHKIFLFIGPKRSGKGTIQHIIVSLLGKTACVGVHVEAFSESFGMMPMIGKSVCFLPDQRNHGRGMSGSLTERLLTISGQDEVSINRKNKDYWTGILGTRVIFMSNDIPQLPDASGVIASRFVPIVFVKSFYGCEDTKLFGKLVPELPQILNWALIGLKRIRERGQFILTPAATDMLSRIQTAAAPHLEFFDETLIKDIDGVCLKKSLYESYTEWCEDHRHIPCSQEIFGNRVKMAYPHIQDSHPRIDGKQVHVWRGIRIIRDEDAPTRPYPDLQMAFRSMLTKIAILRASGHPIDPEDEQLLAKVTAIFKD
jgi:putative DNA primase/helicase